MFFIELHLIGGRGGDGIISWNKSRRNSRLGPSGGSGGSGGSIYITANSKYSDFSHLRKNIFHANAGSPGEKNYRSGVKGADLTLHVPIGTKIYDLKTNLLKAEIKNETFRYLAAKGGRGGRGNSSFKSSLRQSPWLYELGDEGEKTDLLLLLPQFTGIGMANLLQNTEDCALKKILPFNALRKPNTFVPVKLDNQLFYLANLTQLIPSTRVSQSTLRELSFTSLLLFLSDLNEFELKKYIENMEKSWIQMKGKPILWFLAEKYSLNLRTEILNYFPRSRFIYFEEILNMSEKDLINIILKNIKSLGDSGEYLPPNSISQNEFIEYSDILFPEKEEPKILKTELGWEISSQRLKFWSYKIPQTTIPNIERLKRKLKLDELEKKVKEMGGKSGDSLKIYNFETVLS